MVLGVLPGVAKNVLVNWPVKRPLLGIVPKAPVRGVSGRDEEPRLVSTKPDKAWAVTSTVICAVASFSVPKLFWVKFTTYFTLKESGPAACVLAIPLPRIGELWAA